MSRILIVDDEPGVLNALKRSLRSRGWILTTCTSAEDALDVIARDELDLVISDYRMPGMDGVTFLKEVKAVQPDSFRIIMSGHADMDAVLKAINEAEIYRFVTKPWDDQELAVTIERALHHRNLILENRRLADMVREQKIQLDYHKTELERLESESPGITRVDWADDGSIILSDEDF